MGPFELTILSVVTIVNVAIVWVIASQSWHIPTNRYFVVAVSGVILWAVGTLMLLGGSSLEVAGIGRQLFLAAPMYTIFFLSLFAAVFPQLKGHAFTWVNRILGLLCVILSVFMLLHPTYWMPEIILQPSSNVIHVNPFWYSLYSLYYNYAFIVCFGQFYLHLRRARGSQHQQVLFVFVGTALSAAVSLVTNLILPIFGNLDWIWLGPTSTLFYVVAVSYSIVKHQLFDIKLAAVRSIVYLGVLLSLSVIYYACAYIVSFLLIGVSNPTVLNVNPFNIGLALVLAFLFQPIKSFFDRVTNDIFYHESYRSEDFFASLSDLLSSTPDLRGLLERASENIASTFKSEQVFFVLYYSNGGNHHMSAGTPGHARVPVHDAHMLDSYCAKSADKLILTQMLEEEESRVQRMLKSHGIAMVMPLRQGENMAGYLMLGDHRSDNFTRRDMNVLLAINSELVIAIQNALSLHEVKELNATLQQRIDVATKELRSSNAQLKHLDEVKDEFMSMASHQLRTPLTSIKGYLSMVLEGDAGNVTPRQQQLLVEAFKSSERMVRLIADFLNVSRLQTGKFIIEKTPFDLKEAVKQEMRNLEMIARSHDIKLKLTVDPEPMPVNADEQKIRQVVMNLIDNAIYYSHAKSTIVVKLEHIRNDVALSVVDTGIGVPDEEQHRLFTKFYRAPNARKARPDGTGVGLYLARKVITEHDGSIIFSSKEGKGSTFGFRLPMSKVPIAVQRPVYEPSALAAKNK